MNEETQKALQDNADIFRIEAAIFLHDIPVAKRMTLPDGVIANEILQKFDEALELLEKWTNNQN